VSALLRLPCSGKKDISAVNLSFDADVWLQFPDLVSKVDVKKLEKESWFIYVFL
jgi:hypothetical protein